MSKGRRSKKPFYAGKIFAQTQDAPLTAGEAKMRLKKITRLDATLKRHVARALKGDIVSAEMLLTMHEHSRKHGDFKEQIITVTREGRRL